MVYRRCRTQEVFMIQAKPKHLRTAAEDTYKWGAELSRLFRGIMV